MIWPYGRQTPDNNLFHWVSERFPKPKLGIRFLDVGSGSGVNTWELRQRGFVAYALDSDPNTEADFHVDIRKFDFPHKYDAIIDINCLCHVPDPRFAKIRNGLKPDGYFFSICPMHGTSERVKIGKEYTRLATCRELREMLKMFSEVRLGDFHRRLPGGESYRSYIIEAKP